MLDFKSHLTPGKMLLSLIKLLGFVASGETQSVLRALQDRKELQGCAGAGSECSWPWVQAAPTPDITHVAEEVLHSGNKV